MLSQRTRVISTWVACEVLDHFDASRDELVTAIRELGEERSGLHAENERLRAALVSARDTISLMRSFGVVGVCVDAADKETCSCSTCVIDRVLASPAPSASGHDVDAATGCADDQSGLGAAVVLLGRERVDQIMSGADSVPGTDWRKLCGDHYESIVLWNVSKTDEAEARMCETEAAIYDAVRCEREREKKGKANA